MILGYIDPGTGNMLIQVLIAIVASLIIYFTKLKKIIKNLFKRDKNREIK